MSALLYKLRSTGLFDFKTMAAKLYIRLKKQHGAGWDGSWYHYLDEGQALGQLIANHPVTHTTPRYQITLVVYRQCDFTFMVRVGSTASEKLEAQIVWRGEFMLYSLCISIHIASDDYNGVQPAFVGAIYHNLDTDKLVSVENIDWYEHFARPAHWALVLPVIVSCQHCFWRAVGLTLSTLQ